MSDNEALRRQAQEQLTQTPSMQNLTYEGRDFHATQTYNNELDRLRREQDERNRQR